MKLLKRKPAVCASIMVESVEDAIPLLTEASETADLVEIRADALKFTSGYAAEVKRLLRRVREMVSLPVILTVRSEREGGVFAGSESELAECLLAGATLADAVDVELRMEHHLREEVVKHARSSGVQVIVSYHDFQRTPEIEVMREVVEEELAAGADIPKIGVMARSCGDVLRLLQVCCEFGQRMPFVGVAMGETGRVSRVAAPALGSAITYGYVGAETAPGQLSVRELVEVLSLMGLRNG